MQIGITTGLRATRAGAGGGGAPAAINVADFSRDRIVYDSGFAFGRDYATVPVVISGAPAAEPVQARAYSLSDGGATSSAWFDIGTTDGAGGLIGAITPLVNQSLYRLEVRLANQPAVTAQTANRFAVGHVMAFWGQSELARWWDASFSNHAPEPLVTRRQQVERLKNIGKTGRTSLATLKVPGVDTLPAGATIVGRQLNLSGTGALTNWDLADYTIRPLNGARWVAVQCRVQDLRANPQTYLVDAQVNGELVIKRTTFVGSSSDDGCSAAIYERVNGGGTAAGKVTLEFCRFDGFTTDACKFARGGARWCYFKYRKNLAQIPVLWNSATTYGLGDYVYKIAGGAGPAAFKSKISGNLNNVLPGKGSSDANWQAVDPHVDPVTFVNAYDANGLEYCYIDGSESVIANGGINFNNYVRFQNDDGLGSFNGTKIRYCLCVRAAEQPSIPFQVTSSFAGNVTFEGNWIDPRASDGEYFYPVNATIGARVTWMGNTDLAGAALAVPANCQTAAFTAETNADMVQMVYHQRDQLSNGGAGLGTGAANLRHKFISDAAPHTASFVAMANTLLAERPGEWFCVAHHTLSGTGPSQVFANGAARPWIDEQAIHDYVTASGAKVGLVGSSWYASPIGWGSNYGQGWFEIVAGTKTDGSTLGSPRVILSGTASQFTATNLLADLYGPYTDTKFVLYGPHRFEETVNLMDATHQVGGALRTDPDNIQRIRASNKAMLANPLATMFLKRPVDPLSYETGHTNGAGGWMDLAHPNDQTANGLARFARLSAHALMQAAGMTGYAVPEFDQATWEATGAYVDVGSSAGPVTTTRVARGNAPIALTYPHRTDVAGWQINGVPADRAELVAGKVRIYPNAGSFTGPDTIRFGEGGGGGTLIYPDDQIAEIWKNFPVVDVGAWGIEGFPVSAMPAAAGLANTLPGAAFFTNAVGATAHLKDPSAWPTVASGSDRVHQRLTVAVKGKITWPASTAYVCSLEGGPNFTIDCTPTGSLRLSVKDSANVALITNLNIGTVGDGVYFDLIVTIDITVTNACWTNLNGVITQRNFTASANGLCTANRKFRFLANTAGAAKLSGDFYMLELWSDHVTGGAARPADTFLRTGGRITGPAAAANGSAWKQDANLFT